MDWETLAALTKADADAQGVLEDQAAAQIRALYEGIDWYDHAAITAAALAAGEIAQSSSRVAASMTGAYLTRAVRELGAQAPSARALPLVDPLRMDVASWATAYGRPADTVRFEAFKGATDVDAIAAGLQRLDAISRTDLALARRGQARATFTGSTAVTGYRRVVHPEVSKSGSCGLCIAAADRRYHRGDLMPIHQRCRCTILPITAAYDPGGSLDLDEAFAKAYDLKASTSARDLKELRVQYEVDEHGELGPVLVAKNRSADPGRNRRAREAREAAQAGQPAPTRPAAATRRAAGQSAFDAMTRPQLEQQLRITEGLKDSEWRTRYLEQLRARLGDVA